MTFIINIRLIIMAVYTTVSSDILFSTELEILRVNSLNSIQNRVANAVLCIEGQKWINLAD